MTLRRRTVRQNNYRDKLLFECERGTVTLAFTDYRRRCFAVGLDLLHLVAEVGYNSLSDMPFVDSVVLKCINCTYVSLSLKNATRGLCMVLIHSKSLWPNIKLFHLLIAKLFVFTAANACNKEKLLVDSGNLGAFFRYANSNLNQNKMWLHLKSQMALFSLIRALKLRYSVLISLPFAKWIMEPFPNHL